jgi:hypothetical protein
MLNGACCDKRINNIRGNRTLNMLNKAGLTLKIEPRIPSIAGQLRAVAAVCQVGAELGKEIEQELAVRRPFLGKHFELTN